MQSIRRHILEVDAALQKAKNDEVRQKKNERSELLRRHNNMDCTYTRNRYPSDRLFL